MIFRWMLWRRAFDAPLVALAVAMLVLGNGIGKAILVLFTLLGINLVFGRHRVVRYLDPAFALAVGLYFAWAAGLILWRGEILDGNRFLTYAATVLAGAFLAPAFALVRRPLVALVSGARIATVAALLLTLIAMTDGMERVGIGFNVALFAFLVAVAGLVSRIRVEGPPALLPNGVFWSYFAALPVVVSGTRAAWFPFVLMALLDLARLLLGLWRGGRFAVPALAASAAVAAAAIFAFLPVVEGRIADATRELERLEATGVATGSLDVRIVMWEAAAEVLADHPLAGVGPEGRIAAVAERAEPQNRAYVLSYTHLHHFMVDEAVSNGLVGLALLLSILGVFLWRVVRAGERNGLISSSLLFLSLIVSFGSFHGVFLNERTLAMIFVVMALILTHLRRRRLGGSFAPAGPRRGASALR